MNNIKRPRRSLFLAASVLVGGAALAVLGAVGFFLTHHDSTPASADSAEAELSRLRAHLASRPAAAPGRLHSFHTVIYDTRGGGRLVRIQVPYWFGRLFAGRSGEFRWLGELTFLDDTEFDGEPIHLTVKDLHRRGPGVLADRRHATGGQLITWVE